MSAERPGALERKTWKSKKRLCRTGEGLVGAARRRCRRFPKQNLGGRYWEMGILLVLRLTQVSGRKGSEWGSPSFPSHSSQPQAFSPSETGRNQLPPSRHLATEPTAGAPGRHQVLQFLPARPQRLRARSNLVSFIHSTSFSPGDFPGHPLNDDSTATLGSQLPG